jgi:hypothetical protein
VRTRGGPTRTRQRRRRSDPLVGRRAGRQRQELLGGTFLAPLRQSRRLCPPWSKGARWLPVSSRSGRDKSGAAVINRNAGLWGAKCLQGGVFSDARLQAKHGDANDSTAR